MSALTVRSLFFAALLPGLAACAGSGKGRNDADGGGDTLSDFFDPCCRVAPGEDAGLNSRPARDDTDQQIWDSGLRDAGIADTDAGCVCCVTHPILEGFARMREEWPTLTPGISSRSFSSFDRAGGNADGFDGEYGELYEDESGEHVLFDALGPGVVRTIWFTGPEEGGEGFDLGLLRFYFDDEPVARIEIDSLALFRGETPPFVPPLVADNRNSTGGYVSAVPLPYAGRLKITSYQKAHFYAVQYDTHPVDASWGSFAPDLCYDGIIHSFEASLSGDLAEGVVAKAPITTPAGDTMTFEAHGNGAITAFRFVPDDTTEATLRSARVRLFWDGAAEPAVDVPFDTFFGSGLGEADIHAAVLTIRDGIFENRFVMPFWQGYRIEIEGASGELSLRTTDKGFDPAVTGYFHARHAVRQPTVGGLDFEWLDLEATGKLVGTVLTVRPPEPTTKRWWEGDLRSYVNGAQTPSIQGTGHEDDHLGGWPNTFLSGPFSLPMHGEPKVEMLDQEGQYNGNVTMYRLWSGISFEGGIRHSVEHGNENSVIADYEGVAFFYALAGPPRLLQTDTVDVTDAFARADHLYQAEGESMAEPMTSAFEGRMFDETVTGSHMSHTGAAAFTLVAPAENRGCFLRKRFDQAIPRQRAAVFVNGEAVGEWYIAEGNVTLRWAERDLFLPATFTAGLESLYIDIQPTTDGPPWDAAAYALWCVKE